jgi:hypothetical protein
MGVAEGKKGDITGADSGLAGRAEFDCSLEDIEVLGDGEDAGDQGIAPCRGVVPLRSFVLITPAVLSTDLLLMSRGLFSVPVAVCTSFVSGLKRAISLLLYVLPPMVTFVLCPIFFAVFGSLGVFATGALLSSKRCVLTVRIVFHPHREDVNY